MTITADRPLVRNPEIRVIENCAKPRGGHVSRVAAYARCRIIRRDVIGHRGPVGRCVRIVRLVATIAIRRRIARRVIPSYVAVRASIHHSADRARHRRARRQHVRSLQGEARRAVVKLPVGPQQRVVARRAHGRRETRGDVIRHDAAKRWRAIPRRLVATVAIRVRDRERIVVANVAVRAEIHFACWRQLVRTRQRPAGSAVIENRRSPGDGVVARRAVRRRKWRSGARVHWIVRTVVRRQVALRIPAVGRLNGQR